MRLSKSGEGHADGAIGKLNKFSRLILGLDSILALFIFQKFFYNEPMANQSASSVSWFNYPVAFYFDMLERPWAIFSGCWLVVYILSFRLEISYLDLIVPATLITQILTVGAAIYWYAVRRPLPWASALAFGGLLGFFIGLSSAILAFLRWWHLWLFFNLITESIITMAIGVAVALATIWLFKLPWLNKFAGFSS